MSQIKTVFSDFSIQHCPSSGCPAGYRKPAVLMITASGIYRWQFPRMLQVLQEDIENYNENST